MREGFCMRGSKAICAGCAVGVLLYVKIACSSLRRGCVLSICMIVVHAVAQG